MPRHRLYVCCAILVLATSQAPSQSTNKITAVAEIEAYCKEVDAFKKSNPNRARFFGDVSSWDQSGMTLHAPSPKWREFETQKARESAGTGDNLYDVADIWIKDDKVVLAEFWFGSPSGDWSQNVIYYFREDGTLAKMQSTYAGFNLNPFPNREEFGARLVQSRLYDATGKRLRKTLQCFDLGEKPRQRKCSGDYSHHEGAVYLKVQRLPVYKLLNTRSKNAPRDGRYHVDVSGLKRGTLTGSNRKQSGADETTSFHPLLNTHRLPA